MSSLLQKRVENGRRRQRETLLAACTPGLAQVLAAAPCQTGPAADALAGSWPWPPEVAGGPPPQNVPGNWTCQSFDQPSALRRATLQISLPAGAAYLWLGPELPLFELDCSHWRETAEALIDLMLAGRCSCLAMVCSDSRHGLLLSEYIGRLEGSSQAGELVYELAHW